jgi:predicted glycosyltransferase
MDKLAIEPIFAAGPLFSQDDDKLSPFKVVRSHNLHEMFGPDTIVVTRGGYNTCWEAVAAGAGLIIVGEHLAHGVEDVGTRGRFLAAEGVAKHVETNASEILKACTELIEQPASMRDHYLRLSVNSGLSLASDEILGLSSDGCFAVTEPVSIS